MRYYHILALGLMALFGSCRQYEDMPDDRNYPTTYINEEIKSIESLLRSSEHGWLLTLVPSSGEYGGHNLCVKFASKGEAKIFSEDYKEVIDSVLIDPKKPELGKKPVYKTEYSSTYHFSHNGGVRLTFDTFNAALHHYSNPQWGVPEAYNGDFDFVIEKVSADKRTITLRGGRTKNRMTLLRIDEDPKVYFEKISESQAILKAKALSPLQLGGKEVALSVFGNARQLWARYDDQNRLLPIVFTDKGLRLLTPLVIGTDTLRTLELNSDKTAVTTNDGKQTLTLFAGTYDLTHQSTQITYEKGKMGEDAYNLFLQVQQTQEGDVYPGTFGNDVYWGSYDDEMPKVTLQFLIKYWFYDSWGSYYVDFTSIYGKANQFHMTRIIQKDLAWLFGHRAFDWYLQSIMSNSPYQIDPISGEDGYVRISSVANSSSYWLRGTTPK